MEQFGVLDAIALGGVVTGQPTKGKRFVTQGQNGGKGASSKTSYLSKNLRKMDLGTFQKAKWAPTLNNLAAKTTSKPAFFGRWIPWVGSGILIYDTSMTLYNTQQLYNRIIINGK